MARLIYGKIEFDEEQTKRINEMKIVWEKKLLEEIRKDFKEVAILNVDKYVDIKLKKLSNAKLTNEREY